MSQYGLVELRRGEGGTLVPRVPYDQVRLDVPLTGAVTEGVDGGP
jgi:predicted transcriptional regulator